MEVADTLAYHDMATITAVKSNIDLRYRLKGWYRSTTARVRRSVAKFIKPFLFVADKYLRLSSGAFPTGILDLGGKACQ